MRDVAALAEVSVKTVSRVANGEARVSADIASLVDAAVQRLDFHPNPATRSLRRGDRRTWTIGLLLEDVALIGFDDLMLADLLEPPVSLIAQDPATIGRTAAQLLFSRLDGQQEPPRQVVVPTRLIARGSGEIPPP